MSEKIGKENEKTVARRYKKQGYTVLNAHDKGFPDLIILQGSTIKFFVEVKGGRHEVHLWQEKYHKKLERMGFKVKIVRLE
jgi:Holliday junction resolvase-like predicted endonuclease